MTKHSNDSKNTTGIYSQALSFLLNVNVLLNVFKKKWKYIYYILTLQLNIGESAVQRAVFAAPFTPIRSDRCNLSCSFL